MRFAFVAAAVKVGLLLPLFTANAEMYTYRILDTWWMIGYSVNEFSRLTVSLKSSGFKSLGLNPANSKS